MPEHYWINYGINTGRPNSFGEGSSEFSFDEPITSGSQLFEAQDFISRQLPPGYTAIIRTFTHLRSDEE